VGTDRHRKHDGQAASRVAHVEIDALARLLVILQRMKALPDLVVRRADRGGLRGRHRFKAAHPSHDPGAPVDDHHLAGLEIPRGVAHVHHTGHAHLAGHHRAVGEDAADLDHRTRRAREEGGERRVEHGHDQHLTGLERERGGRGGYAGPAHRDPRAHPDAAPAVPFRPRGLPGRLAPDHDLARSGQERLALVTPLSPAGGGQGKG
jgi:hypothetical protein